MSKLVKVLENDTDFNICIYLMKSGKWVVTIYDFVNKTHEKQEEFDSYGQALLLAKQLNKNYMVNENIIKLNGEDLKYMVKETVNKLMTEEWFNNSDLNEKDKKNSNKNDNDNKMSDEKKTRIITILKQDEIDKAPYAYALWPDKEKDSARSYFYKCLNQEPNDDGVPYSFSEREFVKLYSMLSNMKSI